MTEPADKSEMLPEQQPLHAVLQRHGITDPSQYLVDHKDVPIDRTPRIDGVPLISREEVARRTRKLRFL